MGRRSSAPLQRDAGNRLQGLARWPTQQTLCACVRHSHLVRKLPSIAPQTKLWSFTSPSTRDPQLERPGIAPKAFCRPSQHSLVHITFFLSMAEPKTFYTPSRESTTELRLDLKKISGIIPGLSHPQFSGRRVSGVSSPALAHAVSERWCLVQRGKESCVLQ